MAETTEIFIGAPAEIDVVNSHAQDNEFVRVVPYGDAPQALQNGTPVVQRFTRESAEKIVRAFKDNAKRLLCRFGFANAAVPFYNGHPDASAQREDASRDTEVYAEATDLEARDDGLWAKIRRKPALELLKRALGNLQISPRWLCRPSEEGVFEPFRLLSFGLVERGNIPNAEMINSLALSCREAIGAIAKELDVPPDVPESALASTVLDIIRKLVRGLADAETALAATRARVADAENESNKARDVAKKRSRALANELVRNASVRGILPPHELNVLSEELLNAQTDEEFDAVAEKLATAEATKSEAEPAALTPEPPINTAVREAIAVAGTKTPADYAREFNELIRKESEKGATLEQAYTRVLLTKSGRDLFESAKSKSAVDN